MLNKLRKSKLAVIIRRKLLSIPSLKRSVRSCMTEQAKLKTEHEAQQIHIRWELILSGQTMQDNDNDHRTLADVTNEGVTVSYMNGRAVGQEHAGPVFHRLDVVNWGGM